MAKQIGILFGAKTTGNPKNIALNGAPISHSDGEGFNAAFAKLLGYLLTL